MCFKGNTYRSSRRDKHENARPYVREKNVTINTLTREDYVPNFISSRKTHTNF